jgi:hypothetical protein
MALLPPIPENPADRPESWAEYQSRRSLVALHRGLLDELNAWVKQNPEPGSGFFRWQLVFDELQRQFGKPRLVGAVDRVLPLTTLRLGRSGTLCAFDEESDGVGCVPFSVVEYSWETVTLAEEPAQERDIVAPLQCRRRREGRPDGTIKPGAVPGAQQ